VPRTRPHREDRKVVRRMLYVQSSRFGLIGLALLYALAAGLRTVGDFDLGWQLATGRWEPQPASAQSHFCCIVAPK